MFLNYEFAEQVSDEEEIAISDEDENLLATGRSFAESPFRQAKLNATLQCIGAVRKASFLLGKRRTFAGG